MFEVLIIAVIAGITLISGENSSRLGYTRDDVLDQPSARFFPLFSVVRFANSECSGTNSFIGTCFTRKECWNYGGISAGTCANKLGVCCTFIKECGSTTSMNNTYFVNPGWPLGYQGERCGITVNRCNSNICQLRIDFLLFSVSQPNASGVCDNDFLLVTGGATTVPRICGENSGQHVYVDFNGANPIMISVVTNTDDTTSRKWILRIQQIACDSVWRAPNGCLQYYNASTGTVTSFNYGTVPNPRVSSTSIFGTRQMQNLKYGVCITMAPDYCTIEWSQADANSFSVSGDASVIDTAVQDTSDLDSDDICDHNYVIVPSPCALNGTCYTTDRFCGTGFVTKTSSIKPFVLYVVTNPESLPNISPPALNTSIERDVDNRGFILKYRQLPCAI